MTWIKTVGGLVLSLILFLPIGRAEETTAPLRASEQVLFAADNPHPWEYRTLGIHSGKSQIIEPQSRALVTAAKSQSGGGVRLPHRNRFKSSLLIQDVYARIEVTSRFIGDQRPLNMSCILRIDDGTQIQSQPFEVTEPAQDKDGWHQLSFQFDPVPDAEAGVDKKVLAVMLSADQPCQFEIDRISLVQYRNISVRVTNTINEPLSHLHIAGETREDSCPVFLKIRDANGQEYQKTATSINGSYSLSWENAPLTLQADNRITAYQGDVSNTMNQAIEQRLFNYKTDNDHLWLSVEGKQIVTSDSSSQGKQPFIPVGVGYARNVIIPAQDEEVAIFCKSMHLNTIRLAFYLRYFNNHENEPIDLDYHLRTFVDPVVQAAKRHGLYVILDCHSYFSDKINEARARENQKDVSRWNEDGVQEWVRRWAYVANYYKNEPFILGYELCNEPHDIEPERVRNWYKQCRDAIREVDQRHILIVGTHDWSHSRALEGTWGGFTDTFDAPYNNTVYAFHDYPTDNHPWLVQKSITAFRDTYKVPVLCTEFGATWWDHDETVCREFQAGMLGLFAKEDVGWMIWALKQTQNNPRTPHPLPNKIQKTLPKATPRVFDSCAYSDIWGPIAHIMGSPFPEPKTQKSAD